MLIKKEILIQNVFFFRNNIKIKSDATKFIFKLHSIDVFFNKYY